jgi:PilZ domain/Gram-negative bacterial TonB protein C-terminal
MSTSTDRLMTHDSSAERRFYPRVAPNQPVYIALGQTNRCLVLNLSENGLLLSTPYPLVHNSVFRVSIGLDGLPDPIEVHVRTLWTSAAKDRAGIQLLDLSEHDREQIRKWQALELGRAENRAEQQPATPPASPPVPSVGAPLQEKTPPLPRIPAYLAPMSATDSLTNSHLDLLASGQPHASRQRRRKSAPPSFVSWTLVGVVMCLAAALLFRSEVFGKFLNRFDIGTPKMAYRPALPSPPSMLDVKTVSESTRIPALPTGPPQSYQSRSIASRPAASLSPRSGNSAPKNFFAQSSLVRPTVIPASAAQPVSDYNRLAALTPTAVTHTPAAIVPASKPAPPVVSTPLQSAITGSIAKANASSPANSNAIVPTTPSQAGPSSTASNSNWPASSSPVAAGRSFLHPLGGGSAVVHMDPTENRVTEITPPRSLTSSFVQLPGERVLDSPALTMHIQRLVRVPGDHWIWRSHKQLVLGELASRVDPQVPNLPTSYGTLTVEATVDKDGRISHLKPLNGSFVFLPSASLAIRQWRYQPTYLDGKAVETQALIELDFHPPARR